MDRDQVDWVECGHLSLCVFLFAPFFDAHLFYSSGKLWRGVSLIVYAASKTKDTESKAILLALH